MSYLLIFGLGAGAWWLTGFYDDLLIQVILIRHAKDKRGIRKVFLGQLLGVCILLVLANVINGILIIMPIHIPTWLITGISGGVLIWLGYMSLRSGVDIAKKLRPSVKIALFAYLFNSLDDFAIVSAGLIHLDVLERIIFAIGFIVGWRLSFEVAKRGAGLKSHWWKKFAPWVLIVTGLVFIVISLIDAFLAR